jgi:colanic acid/amylovoran biosynthesis glycosyltransferase
LKEVGAITGKIVTTFHGEVGYTGQKRYKKGYDLLFELGDLILPMSEREKQDLIALGCSPQKIVVHRMGVDLNQFTFVPRQPRSDGKAHLLTVARLVEKKGVEYAIKAVANVLKKYPHIEYDIAGDGPLRSDLIDLIEMFNIGDKIKLLGWKRQEEIVELVKGADILLAPSVTSEDGDQEGIPVVLMEAMAQGLPVLSTYHSGIPELVQDGVSGFLVPERDVDALAEKLEHLVQHPEIWPEMGRAGRAHVERYHDIDKLNDQLVQLYQQLLDGEPSQRCD